MVRTFSLRLKIRHAGILLLLVLCAFAVNLPAWAQTTGTLSGTVRDATGAVIPGAQVAVINTDSKAKRATVSNGEGFFTVNALQTATYNVVVTATNFETTKITGVDIHPGDSKTIANLVLKIGTANFEVTVTAESAGVNLDSPEKSSLITAEDIKRLSTVGRDATELIKTLPGFAVIGGNGSTGSITNGNQGQGAQTMGFGASSVSNYAANGSTPQTGATTVISDGASVTDPGDMGGSISNVNMDMVAEVKVQTSNFGADSAKGPVVINAIGKSGGASYHGSVYLFARNGSLNANDWLNNYNQITRPPSVYYYPGANIGGPVRIPGTNFNRSKKLTFFAGFEYYKQTKFDQLYLGFVPTPSMIGLDPTDKLFPNADLTPANIAAAMNINTSQLATACPNFYTSGTVPNSGGYCFSPGSNGAVLSQQDCAIVQGLVIANGSIGQQPGGGLTPCVPGTGLPVDPHALIYAKFWPKANRTPRGGNGLVSDGYNYANAVTSTHNGYQFHGRLDENFSDASKLYLTYNLESINDQSPIGDGYYYGNDVIPYPTSSYSHARSNSLAVNFTHVFSPTLTNEFVPAGTYYYQPNQLDNRSLVQDSATGWTGGRYFNNGSNQIPDIVDYENGVPDFAMSYYPANSKYFRKYSYNLADNVTKQWRTHSIKAGLYFETTSNDQVPYAQSQGTNSFNHYQQGCATTVGNDISQLQNVIANFVQGCSGFTQASNSTPIALFFRTLDFYLTDEWKATKKLTLTYGVRFDHLGPWTDPHGVGLAVWNPPTRYANVAGVTSDPRTFPGISWHQTNPAVPLSGVPVTPIFYSPRAGLAYDVYGNGKTVVRGGWGAYRFHDSYNDAAGPLGTSIGSVGYAGASNLSCTYAQITQAGYNTPVGARGGPCVQATSPIQVYALDPHDSEQPVTYNYNFTVDQQLKGDVMLELSYVGNRSAQSFTAGNLTNQNVIPLGGLFQPDPLTGVVSTPGTSQQVVQDYRPFPYYTNVYVPTHIGYGNYNAFQGSLNRRKGKLIYGINYTWAKALGIRGDYRTGGVGDPTTLRNNYGYLGFNRNHAANFTYSYQVGNAYRGAVALRYLLNNWEISGITNVQSGPDTAVLSSQTSTGYNLGGGVSYTPVGTQTPVSISISPTSLLGTPDISLQPLVTCSPKGGLVKGSVLGKNYINGNCFSLPQLGTNGSFNLPDIHGPSYFSSDLTVQRSFNLSREKALQFRMAAFNFLNHPLPQFYGGSQVGLGLSFGLPNGYIATTPQQAFAAAVQNSPNFGYTPYKGGYRVVEFGARFNF